MTAPIWKIRPDGSGHYDGGNFCASFHHDSKGYWEVSIGININGKEFFDIRCESEAQMNATMEETLQKHLNRLAQETAQVNIALALYRGRVADKILAESMSAQEAACA